MSFTRNKKNKIFIVLFLFFVSLLAIFSFARGSNIEAYASYGGGDGTATNPYIISLPEHLDQLDSALQSATNGLLGLHFKLEKDIDVLNHPLKTIGDATHAFNGTFNGNSNIIYNIIGENKSNFQGLFYKIGEFGKVDNLGIYNALLSSHDNAGAIAVFNEGSINKCFFSGEIIVTSTGGGLVGINDGGRINLSYSSGKLSANASSKAGGIIGEYISGKVENNYSIMCINSIDDIIPRNYFGGIIGHPVDDNYGNITNNSFGSRDEIITNEGLDNTSTIIPGYNNKIKGIGRLNTSNVIKYELNDYQNKTLYALFKDKEHEWNKYESNFSGEGVFAPSLKDFRKVGSTAEIIKHNHMVKYSSMVKYFGYVEKFESNWATEENPLLLQNAIQFHMFSYHVLNGYTFENKYIKLETANLDLGDSLDKSISGVGAYVVNNQRAFKGVFDGSNYEIKSFYVRKLNDNNSISLGLFNNLDNATIKNLTISANTTVDGYTGEAVKIKNLGGLAGFSRNSKFENILVKTTIKNVEIQGNLGGIISQNFGGEIQTVMFYGKLMPHGNESDTPTGGRIGGIIAYDEGATLTCINAWHFVSHTQRFLLESLSNNYIGNVFVDTNTDASDNIVKSTARMEDYNSSGNIYKTFVIESFLDAGATLSIEYRHIDETEVWHLKADATKYYTNYAASSIYSATDNLEQRVFARFVRTVEIKRKYNAESVTETKEPKKFYVGQKVSIYAEIREGFYLSKIEGYVTTGSEVLLNDLPLVNPSEGSFYKKVGLKDAIFGDEPLKENYVGIIFTFEKITFESGFFGESAGTHSHIYQGESITVDTTSIPQTYGYNGLHNRIKVVAHYENISNDAGIKSNYDYDNERIPYQANTDAIKKYYLDYVIYIDNLYNSENNRVFLGKRQIEYIIEKKTIDVPDSAIITYKEYNNIMNLPEDTPVRNYDIPDIFQVDKDRVIVAAKITYKGLIGPVFADVSLSIHDLGSDISRNYKIDADKLIVEDLPAEIHKRKIYIPIVDIVDIEKEYNNRSPDIKVSIENASSGGNTLITRGDLIFEYTRDGDANLDKSLPGRFKTTVEFKNSDKGNYFEIGFTQSSADSEYINIVENPVWTTIHKRKVNIIYSDIDNLIYDGQNKTINLMLNPEYMDSSGAIIKLPGWGKTANYVLKLNGEIVDSILNAGEYTVEAVGFEDDEYTLNDQAGTLHKYLVIESSTSKTINILKAPQGEIEITSPNTYSYSLESPYLFEATGGIVGDYIYSINAENDSDSGEGVVLSTGELQITKAGKFVVTATRQGNENYLPTESTTFILQVAKSVATLSVEDLTVEYGFAITPTFKVNDLESLPYGFQEPEIYISKSGLESFALLDITKKYIIGNYKLRISAYNAKSDVYEFENVDIRSNLVVAKRNITVSVEENIETFYGVDVPIPYSIIGYEEEIQGSLSRQEGKDVIMLEDNTLGGYTIEPGDLPQSNPNFNISFNFIGKYIIKPTQVSFSFLKTEKFYGDIDPDPKIKVEGLKFEDTAIDLGLTYSVIRVAGESARNDGYDFSVQNIEVESPNYKVSFLASQEGKLYINKASVVIKNLKEIKKNALEDLTVYVTEEGNKLADFYTKVYRNGAWENEDTVVSGRLEWSDSALNDENKKLDFYNSPTLTRQMKFIIDSSESTALLNYKQVTTFDVTIIPIKIDVEVNFTKKTDSAKYRGVAFRLDELIALDVYERASSSNSISGNYIKVEAPQNIKDVGDYVISISINGYNHNLVGAKSTTLTISKAELDVKLEDMTYLNNKIPKTANITYTGFVSGEGQDSLSVLPKVTLPTVAGSHKLTPSGGQSENYTFHYKAGNIIVKNYKVVSSDETGIKSTFYGEFSNSVQVNLKANTDAVRNSQAQSQINALSKTSSLFKNKSPELILQVQGQEGNEVKRVGVEKIVFTAPEAYQNLKSVNVMLVDINNKVFYANAQVEDGFITVEGANIEYIVFVKDKPPYLLYAGIGVGAIIVILALFAIVNKSIKKRKAKKYIKFKQS